MLHDTGESNTIWRWDDFDDFEIRLTDIYTKSSTKARFENADERAVAQNAGSVRPRWTVKQVELTASKRSPRRRGEAWRGVTTCSANQSSDSLINKSSSIVTAADTSRPNVNPSLWTPVRAVYMSGAKPPTSQLLDNRRRNTATAGARAIIRCKTPRSIDVFQLTTLVDRDRPARLCRQVVSTSEMYDYRQNQSVLILGRATRQWTRSAVVFQPDLHLEQLFVVDNGTFPLHVPSRTFPPD